jgi:hypothetical protein
MSGHNTFLASFSTILVEVSSAGVFVLCMDFAKLGGAAGAMAAVATAVAALGAVPAAAADSPPPAAAIIDGAAIEAAADGIVEQAAAATEEIAAAPASPPPTATETGQYHPQEPQYHDQDEQYHEPTPVPEVPAAPVADAPAPQGPVNINVGVRVLSPGDDGAVSQGTSAAPSVVAGQAAISTTGTTSAVSITVNVNVSVNWNLIWPSTNEQTWYQPTDRQYHDPSQIAYQIAAQVSPEPPSQMSPQEQETEGAAPDRAAAWHPVPAKGRRDTTGSGRGKRDATGHPRGLGRGHSATWLVVVAASPSAAWESTAEARRRPTPPGDERAPAAASRPTRAPLPQTPPTPQTLGAGAAAGGVFSTFMNTLAVLVAALGLATLHSARRLGLPSRRLQEADGPRPEKPG